MKQILKPLTDSYYMIVLLAVVCWACRAPEAKENVLVPSTVAQDAAPAATDLLLQSTDGGVTWQDISAGLPDAVNPEGFFSGPSAVYVHVKNELYHSANTLPTPVWEKENFPDLQSRSLGSLASTMLAFNRSGVMAYNYDGQIYQKTSAAETWLPVLTTFKNDSLRTILETADGTLLLGTGRGIYKSTDQGENWKQVHHGPVYNLVESAGVVLGTRGTSIMRSTDAGEHWEWIINEGRVGHGIEAIEGGFIAVTDGGPKKLRTIRISLDGAQTWTAIDEGLPASYSISSIKQIGHALLCGHPDGIYRSTNLGKTWTRVYAPREKATGNKLFIQASYPEQPVNVPKTVFTIYTSGSTVYAVARVAGC